MSMWTAALRDSCTEEIAVLRDSCNERQLHREITEQRDSSWCSFSLTFSDQSDGEKKCVPSCNSVL